MSATLPSVDHVVADSSESDAGTRQRVRGVRGEEPQQLHGRGLAVAADAVLQHDADPRPQVARLRERVLAEHADGALVGLPQALAALDRGGLACTVGAEHRGHLTVVGDEVEPVDDGTSAVALDEPGDLERGGVGHEREV